VRLASFGANGMAFSTLQGIASHPAVRVVCVAEIDSSLLGKLKKAYPDGQVKVYQDWRRMLDRERHNLDAACIGTPDHMHAPMAMSAMRLGLPVYVQKPLTHEIFEARRLAEYARKKKLVTQMGIQIHPSGEYRTAKWVVDNGAIGKVKEVHLWSSKKWGDPEPRPDRSDPAPPGLDWDGWIGVAAPRPYLAHYYHPSQWRRRVDFGTGDLGDMACHILDPIFTALELTAPLSVRSDGPAPNRDNWPNDFLVRYVFPGTTFTQERTLNVTWYSGERRPPSEIQMLLEGNLMPDQGSILIGSEGSMLVPHIGFPSLYPTAKFSSFQVPKIKGGDHYHEFVDAVLGKGQTSTPFDYSGRMTEAVLLGNIAARFPSTTLEWDAKKLKITNLREANGYIRRRYRQGWKVKGL